MVEIAMGFAVNHHYVIILALQIEAKKAGILNGRFSRTNFCVCRGQCPFEFCGIFKKGTG